MAFESLVKKYDRQVMQIAASMVNNAHDAEDIYQEVFVRVHRNLRRFQFRSEFSTWLYRVVVNYCINFQKKRRRNRAFSLDSDFDQESMGWQLTIADAEKTPEQSMLNQELSNEIDAALDQLSSQQKLVFVLRHYHGFKLKDIAAMMGCSLGTIKNYLFRATQKMQSQLRDHSHA